MSGRRDLFSRAEAVVAWTVMCLLVLPIVIVVPVSFSSAPYLQFPPPGWSLQWYERYFTDAIWVSSTILSLQIGAVSTLLALALGVPLAFALVRGRFVGRFLLERATLAPMIIPTIVFSVAIYSLFSSLGLVGKWYGIAIAHTVLGLPYVVIIMVAALRNFDVAQESAAQSLGASSFKAVLYVTLPQLAPSLYSSAFLAFIASFDELVVSMFLSGSFKTLPKKMFDNILVEIDPTIAAVSVLKVVAVLILFSIVMRKGSGAESPFASKKSNP